MAVANAPFDLLELKLAAPATRPGTVTKPDVIARLCASPSRFATVVAPAGYEAVFELHALGAIGTFDSAVIRKEDDGKVRVTKTEKPTQHGAWTGAGVGALVGLVFPPAVIGSAIVGAGAGGLIGHLRKGISRGDLKELGDELDAGTAAVIVFGESKLEEQLEKALARAEKVIAKEMDADAEELEREIEAAARDDAK